VKAFALRYGRFQFVGARNRRGTASAVPITPEQV
jgi:hypothetical protein